MDKGKIILFVIFGILILAAVSSNNERTTNNDSVPKITTTPTPTVEPTPEHTPYIETEADYKAKCVEMYYDDFFKVDNIEEKYVQFYGFTSQKFTYGKTDTIEYLLREITQKYNLDSKYLGCCIMHEETKNEPVPIYAGKSAYIMFPKDGEYNIDTFKTGQYIYVYGEIIKTTNGIFILPKYMEYQNK